ncbi:hypothetical protein QE152_g25682 [Popillia japonica]|uniref:AAA+ ATPase domain-containing protein n=1 Tax=Popillia japonica TaxID=7064 RepID=A0AAW1K0U3_POPJA
MTNSGRPKKKLFNNNDNINFELTTLIERKMGGELLSQTKRIIIIGPSGSGKSTIAQEIIFGMERKSISEINYFLTNGNELEKDIQVIKELCKDAFIYFNIYRYEKDSIPNELRTHSLNIFDDAHKKTGITDLAEKLFTEGRHRQQHVIYIQQTGTFIPAGMKSSYSEIIIHKSIINDLENYINIDQSQICNEYTETGFYTINKNSICYPTKLCDYKSFREYKNRLKAVGRNTEDEYNSICYPTKLCDYKSFREYKNRLKAVGRNTEDEYKNNIKNLNVIYKAYKNAGADGANKTMF